MTRSNAARAVEDAIPRIARQIDDVRAGLADLEDDILDGNESEKFLPPQQKKKMEVAR